jgi:hypothetical protein
LGKLKHQAFQFRVGLWTSSAGSVPIRPLSPEQLAMPFEDGFGLEAADHVTQSASEKGQDVM